MEEGITVNKYIDSKQVTFKEVEELFELVKKIEVDTSRLEGCAHCGDTANQYRVPSEPWTACYQCVACGCLMMTVFSDRMGGGSTDTVFVYEQKNRPMFRLYFKCDTQKDCIECRHCGTVSSDKDDIEKRFCKKCNKTLS